MEGVRRFVKQELLKGLTEEQIKKVKACKNQEELLKFLAILSFILLWS